MPFDRRPPAREAALDPGYELRTCWQAFGAHTTRAMTARLAEVLDKVLAQAPLASSEGTSLLYSANARQ